MKSRENYEEARAVVASVVRQWDPYGLLAGGAPIDEFDAEIANVVTRVPSIHSVQDAVRALSEVFSEAFEVDTFTPARCASQGALLYSRLADAGLLLR